MADLAPAAPASRRRFPWAFFGLAAAFAFFVAGVVELFQLRFEAGDVYPVYSTLRNDPLGAAAFYEALAKQPNLRVERNFRPLDRLGLGPVTLFNRTGVPPAPAPATGTGPLTFFYLGADPSEWPFLMDQGSVDRLEEILRGGGRIVLTFRPGKTPLTAESLAHKRTETEDLPSPSPGASPKHKPTARELRQREEIRRSDLIERWGMDFHRTESKKAAASPTPGPTPRRSRFGLSLPSPTPTPEETPAPELIGVAKTARPVPGTAYTDAGDASWHTALDFQPDTPAARAAGWRAVYERDGRPVIVSRPFGPHGGEIVLVSDSYFLSNEALRAEPHPALLAALVGGGRHLIFDESHQGVEEQPGLMTLARRYGLQGGLAALGLLAALFIWRNVLSLVPPPPPSADARRATSTVPGRESAVGFLNLVKRGVPPRELLATCLARWQGASRRAPEAAAVARLQALAEVEAARPARDRAPAAVYRAMCAAVRPRR